jgi:subtilisin family serine protease
MGVTLVAAGGNSNVAPLMYPAQLPGVASVVAVTNADIKTPFSNYGFGADVSAPGYGLWVAYPGNQMTYAAGTSYASPLVAAEAADVIDSYQQIFRGQPSSFLVNRQISRAVLPIDWLNPGYTGQLGSGRIYIPFSVFGSWQGAF